MADDPTKDSALTGSGGARYVTVAGEAGQRIDNFLLRELKGLPRSRVYRILRRGEVRINGRRVRPTQRLEEGDSVRIPPVRGLSQGPAAEAFVGEAVLATLERAVIHEDDELLVLNKPAGMPVHGGSGLSFGVIEGLRRLRPHSDLGLVHRLDRDTSGCLLVAKSRRVLLALQEALRDRTIKKDYRAAVFGVWSRRTTTVQLPLKRYLTASGERRVRVAEDGRSARTDFRILESAAAATLLAVRLHTGRTHQIRVHAAASGHPLIGDTKYAPQDLRERSEALGVYRLCLHAEALALTLDGRRLRFAAPVPDDLQRAWQALATAPG